MTQALLNNLITENPKIDSNIDFSKKNVAGMDFQEILNKKNELSSVVDKVQSKKGEDISKTKTQEDVSLTITTNEEKNASIKSKENDLENNVEGEATDVVNEEHESEFVDTEIEVKIENDVNLKEDEKILNEPSATLDDINKIILNIMPIENVDMTIKEESAEKNSDETEGEADGEADGEIEDYTTDLVALDNDSVSTIVEVESGENIDGAKKSVVLSDVALQNDKQKQVIISQLGKDDKSNEVVNVKDLEPLQEDVVLEGFFEQDSQTTVAENITLNTSQKNVSKNVDNDTVEQNIVDEQLLEELNLEEVNVDTSTNDENGSNLMQYQSAEEQGVKVMLNAEFEVSDSQLEIQKTTNSTPTQNIKTNLEANPSKILEQITKQLDNLQHNSKVNIVLNPESLGKVVVQLVNTKEGLSAQFTCATQEARNLLMKGVENLKETLTAQGINVENVTIKQEESQSSNYQPDWTEQEGSRGGNKQNQRGKHSKDAQQQFEQAMFNLENENKENV